MSRSIKEANPKLRGWVNYFHLVGNTTIFVELVSWFQRKLRTILWRQWKRNKTRANNLIKLGFSGDAAWRFVRIHRGPWATVGTFNMHRLLKIPTSTAWGWSRFWTSTSDYSAFH